MAMEKITFAGHDGQMLAARLDLPAGPHRGCALFAHCFTCSKDIPAARRIAGRLAAMGLAVLRFDFTGLGHSDGEFANTTFTSNVADLEAAAAYLADRGMAPGLLIGHSLGGAAVLKAAGRIPSAKAVATLGAPFEPGHVTDNFSGSLETIAAEGEATVQLGGRPFRIRQTFVDDVRAEALAPAIHDMKRALLVMHAPGDTTVGIENAGRIFDAALHPKSFVTLDGADHLITRPADAEYAAEVIAAWSSRYLDMTRPAASDTASEGIVRVSETDPATFLQDVTTSTGTHILADEPADVGGTGRGLTPYALLAAGLGACTSMTIRMYAKRKGWSLNHVRVDVSHDRVHAADAAEEKDRQVDTFLRQIRLEGDLDASERSRLMEIADKCPVHRTLERSAQVVTKTDTD